jgi:transcription antitermination factor NusG
MPLVTAIRQFPYVTGIISISAGAVAVKPIAILKTLEYSGDSLISNLIAYLQHQCTMGLQTNSGPILHSYFWRR